jgi:hypothetical protein
MANQLALAFSIATSGSIYTPTQAAAKLSAVPLYTDDTTDPVLGQAFGLTVASDASAAYSQAVLTATNASPIVVGVASTVGLANGMVVTLADATGNTAANGSFEIADLTGDSFALVGSTGNGAYTGGGTVTAPVATRTLTLNMTSVDSPPAPPPFPCRPTGPEHAPPVASPTLPYTLEQTTINRYTLRPVTLPAPAAVVAFYSTSTLDTDGVDTTPAIPAGSGAQIMALTYLDSTGAGPFTVHTKLMGKFPAVVTLAGGSIDVAEITECFVFQTGAFENSVGQITLAALEALLPPLPSEATPADFPDLTDAAQLTITRPLIYLPPSYFALAQQQNSAPQLAGDFWVNQGSPTVLTTVSQIGVIVGEALSGTVDVTHGDEEIVFSVAQTLPAGTGIVFAEQPTVTYVLAVAIDAGTIGILTTPYSGTSAAATTATGSATIEFDAQPGVQYSVASVSATFVKLTTAYTGLSNPEIAPGAETHHDFANIRPARSVSEEADAVVSSAFLVSPSQAAPPDDAHLMTLLAEFTLPQQTAPALTYVDVTGGPFTPGETVNGQKSGGTGTVLYDNPGMDESGTLAFNPGSVKSGFVRSETVTGATSHATATVVNPRTLASNPLPTRLSGLYARTLSLILGAPVVSQPITLL